MDQSAEASSDQPIAIQSNCCLFKDYLDSCNVQNRYNSTKLTIKTKQTVIAKSKRRGDTLHKDINQLEQKYHTLCYSNYTSNEKIERYLKRKHSLESKETTPKRIRRGEIEHFDFKSKCFFCGEQCAVKPDPKNPGRFSKNQGYLCKTADRGTAKFEDGKSIKRKSFKEVILDICNDRSDIEGDKVRIRLEGAPSDLHAAEAVWHLSCHKKFTNPNSILSAQKKKTEPNDLSAVNIVVKANKNAPDRVWT